jgi:hypothetical protein
MLLLSCFFCVLMLQPEVQCLPALGPVGGLILLAFVLSFVQFPWVRVTPVRSLWHVIPVGCLNFQSVLFCLGDQDVLVVPSFVYG